MPTPIKRVKQAIDDFKHGKMVILTDHADREDEADLILPAEAVTDEKINFMIRHSSGIVCIPLTSERLQALDLPLMVPNTHNTNNYGTPFTISVDAKYGITTGVSTADRTKTIQVIMNEATKPEDLVKPGHLFPLQARAGGVLERQGHTEGSTDLARLAGFKPAAIISEIMNPDGTMTRGPALLEFAKKHQLTMLSIDDIIAYRLAHEDLIAETIEANLPLDQYGSFNIKIIKEKFSGIDHIVLSKPPTNPMTSTLVRVHSSCVTGDLFASCRCDCHKQLHYSLKRISEEGGILIYLNQEGRGIGLFNKVKAYALQEQGFDTVDANIELGLPVDARQYYIAANILRHLNIHRIRLLTNNPNKVKELIEAGYLQVEQITLPTFDNEFNLSYLQTKQRKLGHSINVLPQEINQ